MIKIMTKIKQMLSKMPESSDARILARSLENFSLTTYHARNISRNYRIYSYKSSICKKNKYVPT